MAAPGCGPAGRDGVELRLDVALLPGMARDWPQPITIVIDVLRASSSLCLMFERGARRVFPVADLEAARHQARDMDALLVGERQGVAPPDFDLGNSPLILREADLAGREVVFTTTNGTVALANLGHARRVLVGCFNNASACCRHALELARAHRAMIGLVCAGQNNAFALDDGVCAGFLVETLTRLSPEPCRLTDAATAMQRLYGSFASVLEAFEHTASGRNIHQLGEEPDLTLCAAVDTSRVVPVLQPDGSLAA